MRAAAGAPAAAESTLTGAALAPGRAGGTARTAPPERVTVSDKWRDSDSSYVAATAALHESGTNWGR